VFDTVTEGVQDGADNACEAAATIHQRGGGVRFVEKAFYGAVAAALIDTGCNADYARIMVEYGLQRSKLAARRARSLIVS
jgi:hypothetical protein